MSEIIQCKYYNESFKGILSVDVRINIAWAEAVTASSLALPVDVTPDTAVAFETKTLNKTIRIKISHQALEYHYKDTYDDKEFYKMVAKQIAKSMRAILVDQEGFIPKDAMDLILATVESINEVDLPIAIPIHTLGFLLSVQHKHKKQSLVEKYMTPEAVNWHHANNTSQQLAQLARMLPGVNEHVKYPCRGNGRVCKAGALHAYADRSSLFNVIIHLNDHAGWSREDIADWIETLDIDTEFKEPVEVDGRPTDLFDGPFNDEDLLIWQAHQKLIESELKAMWDKEFLSAKTLFISEPEPQPKSLLEQIAEQVGGIPAVGDSIVINISDVKFKALKNKEWKK